MLKSVIIITLFFVSTFDIGFSSNRITVNIKYTPKTEVNKTTHKDLLIAVMAVETDFGRIKESELSKRKGWVGLLQIDSCMIDYVNKYMRKSYTYQDRHCDKKSIEIFYLIQKKFNPEMDIEKGAHIWCAGINNIQKRWHLSENYRNKIKNFLKNFKNTKNYYYFYSKV